jgi:hypothetical protein
MGGDVGQVTWTGYDADGTERRCMKSKERRESAFAARTGSSRVVVRGLGCRADVS